MCVFPLVASFPNRPLSLFSNFMVAILEFPAWRVFPFRTRFPPSISLSFFFCEDEFSSVTLTAMDFGVFSGTCTSRDFPLEPFKKFFTLFSSRESLNLPLYVLPLLCPGALPLDLPPFYSLLFLSISSRCGGGFFFFILPLLQPGFLILTACWSFTRLPFFDFPDSFPIASNLFLPQRVRVGLVHPSSQRCPTPQNFFA